MSGDVQARSRESRGARLPPATHRNIYVHSRRAGERVLASVSRWLERVLRLKVNRAKSAVGRPAERAFLGYRIIGAAQARLSIAPKSLARAKATIRRITRRNRGANLGHMLAELATFTDGWVGYYWQARTPSVFEALDGWVRRRVWCYQWKQWKIARRRALELRKAGVGRYLAWGTAYDGSGLWRVASGGESGAHASLPNRVLVRHGYHSLSTRYQSLAAG